MKTFVTALGALLLTLTLGRPASAQYMSYRVPTYYGGAYAVPAYPYAYAPPSYGYPVYPYYPFPLPPAPSLGFGRGGIYGHVFIGRGDGVVSYTLPGRNSCSQ